MKNKVARRSAFVLRLWLDENGRVYGQVTEPMSGWQRPFAGIDALGQLLLAQMIRQTPKGDNHDESHSQ